MKDFSTAFSPKLARKQQPAAVSKRKQASFYNGNDGEEREEGKKGGKGEEGEEAEECACESFNLDFCRVGGLEASGACLAQT